MHWQDFIDLRLNYQNLISQIDSFSDSFINSNGMEQAFYASTHKNPKTVDKILSNLKADKQEKTALVCFDCMGYAEWYLPFCHRLHQFHVRQYFKAMQKFTI